MQFPPRQPCYKFIHSYVGQMQLKNRGPWHFHASYPLDNFLWGKFTIWGKPMNDNFLSDSLNVVHQEAKIGHLCECMFKNFLIKKSWKTLGAILSFGKWDWRLKHFVEVLLERSCLLCQLGVPSLPGSFKSLEKSPGRKSVQIPSEPKRRCHLMREAQERKGDWVGALL